MNLLEALTWNNPALNLTNNPGEQIILLLKQFLYYGLIKRKAI